MKEINLNIPAILFFVSGIICFVLAYLHFKCKLSVRFREHFYALKEEQKEPNFRTKSKKLFKNGKNG